MSAFFGLMPPAPGCCLVHCAEPATPLAESGRVEIEANPAALPDGGGGAPHPWNLKKRFRVEP